ncbi:signal peptide protein [Pandoraea captiosa]|uniref:Signal peptide protein n=2 Tax=Pandoraea captiosa TaxID=2508302 RepID=A0A5E4ZYP9_9BURK|nr:signal peptide protein [Pandoraea captiosa]
MRKNLSAVFVFSLLASHLALAAAPKVDNDAVVERRAVEAVIWGMPAVNTELMLQAMQRSTSARENEVVYWSKPVNWKNQTLTPNPDSIYFMTFVNTKASGPLVVEIPPADGGSLAVNIVTTWQMPLEDAGPQGADEGKGGKYLILPPDYQDTPPPGYIALRSDTYGGFTLMRSNLASHSDADVAKSVEYGKRIKVYPLSQASAPPPTRFTDAYDVLFDATIRYDASFFKTLNDVVQKEPWIQRDRVMIDHLGTLGIHKGKPYQPDAKTEKILDAAARQAHAELAARYDRGFERMVPEYRWFPAAMPEIARAVSTGYGNPDEYPVDGRGVTYTLGFTGIKRLGTAQFYLMVAKDKNGKDFDGRSTYRLVVPPNAPVAQYWSATAYDRQTHALIRNMPKASVASTTTGIAKNADGSVDIYFGPKAPQGKQANWVPTDPHGKFELLFRLYEPQKPFFDKQWRLPDVEKID